MSNSIRLEQRDRTADLTIARPESRNAINFEMLQELESYLDVLHENPPGLLVLRGADPGFCAGIDLKESREATSTTPRSGP
jgi:enoyl-CoA hydratase